MSGQQIEVEHSGVMLSGYLAEPDGATRAGLIVVQEWWGLNDDIKGITDRYAAEGYLALAPDVYHGQVTGDPDQAKQLMMALDRDLALREIDAAIVWMKTGRGVVQAGCTGFCLGGGLTLQVAARATSNVDAVHAYYSVPTPSPRQAASIRVPVMGSYGAEDELNPVEQVEAMREALARRGTDNDIKIYKGAGHSFFNAGPAYRDVQAQDSWQRSLEWFGRHLSD